mgnify:CR=1 FL=1
MKDRNILKEKVNVLPEKPGVYQFYNQSRELLYVGKAKNLKKRVSSYFFHEVQSRKVKVLVSKIAEIEYIVVNSETDALLLENNLIKKYQPHYNILLKDDKTYPWICVKNEPFPRIYSTRRYIKDGSIYYGPYTSGLLVKTILELIKKIYPIRTCSLNLNQNLIESGTYKSCLEFQIGNCLAPCVGNQTREDYERGILESHAILKGNLISVQKWISLKMDEASKSYKFELAQLYKSKLDILNKFQSKSTIVNSNKMNVEIYNILDKSHYAVVNYLKVVQGSINQIYTIEIKKNLEETKEELLAIAITEIRERISSNGKKLIVPFYPDFMINHIEYKVPLKGEGKKLLDLSFRNCLEYSNEIEKRIEQQNPIDKINRVLDTMQKDLAMNHRPIHIECFDNSNLQGSNPVSSCVVFRNTKPSKRDYRHFNVKTVIGANDYATMEEVVYRRYKRMIDENHSLPQLVVIDGGKGQLSSAAKSLRILGILENVKLIGIAKRLEEIYSYNDSVPLYLDKNSSTLKLLQNVRNEAHRFGIKHHKKKRNKIGLVSELDEIRGIGHKTKLLLFKKYKSIDNILKSEKEDLVKLIGKSKTDALLTYFEKK